MPFHRIAVLPQALLSAPWVGKVSLAAAVVVVGGGGDAAPEIAAVARLHELSVRPTRTRMLLAQLLESRCVLASARYRASSVDGDFHLLFRGS